MRLLVGTLLILSVAARVEPRGDPHAALTLLASHGSTEPAASATADATTAGAPHAARPLIGVVAMPGTSPGGVPSAARPSRPARVRAPAMGTQGRAALCAPFQAPNRRVQTRLVPASCGPVLLRSAAIGA